MISRPRRRRLGGCLYLGNSTAYSLRGRSGRSLKRTWCSIRGGDRLVLTLSRRGSGRYGMIWGLTPAGKLLPIGDGDMLLSSARAPAQGREPYRTAAELKSRVLPHPWGKQAPQLDGMGSGGNPIGGAAILSSRPMNMGFSGTTCSCDCVCLCGSVYCGIEHRWLPSHRSAVAGPCSSSLVVEPSLTTPGCEP